VRLSEQQAMIANEQAHTQAKAVERISAAKEALSKRVQEVRARPLTPFDVQRAC